MGCPLPPYIKEWRRGPAKEGGAPKGGGVQLPPVVGLPFFLLVGEGRKRKEGGKKGGPAPLPIRIGIGGGPSLAPFPSFPLRPNKAHIPPGGFR